jgi:hypothetical protein
MSLVYWAIVAVITVAPAASAVFGRQHHPGAILASAVFGTAFVGVFHANSAGLTGPAFVLEATALGSRRDLRAYFSAQNLVLCLIGAPLVVAVCFALAAAAGDPGMGAEAAPVVLAGIGAALGLGDLFTAALPYPMVKRAGTPVPLPAPGYGGYRIGALLTLAGTAALAAPVIVGTVLAAHGPNAIRIGVMLPCAAAYGFALAAIGVRLAAKIAERKLPEMCQVALRTAT